MPDEPVPPESSAAPTPESLTAKAERVKSQALCVSAARLIHESRYLREQNERTLKKAEGLKDASKNKPKDRPKKS